MTARVTVQRAPRPLSWPDYLDSIRDILGPDARHVYLVGGIVRDALWGLPAHDVDLAIHQDAFRIARQLADGLHGAFYKLDPVRETGRTIVTLAGQRIVIDVATFRGSDLLDDLTARDFTLNAMAAPLDSNDLIIDPLGGLEDATRRILRRCAPTSIQSDPIRALRAVRMAVRFNLRIEPETLTDIRREGPRMAAASPERLRDEFMALLGGGRVTAGLRTLEALGLLPILLPEAAALRTADQDAWSHTLRVTSHLEGILTTIGPQRTDNTAARVGLGMIVCYLDHYRVQIQEHVAREWPNERSHRALLMLAALLREACRPSSADPTPDSVATARQRGEAMRLSRGEAEHMAAIAQYRVPPDLTSQHGALSRRESYLFWRDTGRVGVDICLLALADTLASAGPALSTGDWSRYLQAIDALLDGAFGPLGANVINLPVLVTGHDLMKHFTLAPGQRIGELLERIREEQAAGIITTREEALAFAGSLL
jgi:tRNA nucleotidyltransferase/poly(A) polymerase